MISNQRWYETWYQLFNWYINHTKYLNLVTEWYVSREVSVEMSIVFNAKLIAKVINLDNVIKRKPRVSADVTLKVDKLGFWKNWLR